MANIDEYTIIKMLDDYGNCMDYASDCEERCEEECSRSNECRICNEDERKCYDACLDQCAKDIHEACIETITEKYGVTKEWFVKVLDSYEACMESCVKEEEKTWTLADYMELQSSPYEVCDYSCAPKVAKQFATS